MKAPKSKQSVKIINKLGLHLRAAAVLMKVAQPFHADIYIEKGGKKVNGKSIMSVMALVAPYGSTLTISAKGKDAKKAVETMVAAVNNRFGEKE